MNLRDALIPYDHLLVEELQLPRLLARRLRIDESRQMRPIRSAAFPDEHRDIPEVAKSLEQATVDLVKHIDIQKGDISARFQEWRLQNLEATTFAALVRDIFNWFDEYVFMRKLQHRAVIRPYYPCRNGNALLALNDSGKSVATVEGVVRATIILNCESLPHLFRTREALQAQNYILGAVVHQLIHAYFIANCSPQDQQKNANALLTHGEHFGIVLHKIKSACSSLPLDFGNTVPEIAHYVGRHNEEGGRSIASSMWDDQRKRTTECARDVKVISEGDCKAWYKSKCLKTLDPDMRVYNASSRSFEERPTSKCGPKSDWVEISHDKKPYKVARKLVARFPSLKKNFEDTRKLEVADRVTAETFEEFVCFLHEDRDQYSADSLSLKMCIELYQLAVDIKFEELKDVVFDAMYGHATQVELANMNMDSILHAVRAVYDGSASPDKNLRIWAKQFMKQFGDGMLRAARQDARLGSLRAKRAAFRQDFDQVIRDLGPVALRGTHSPLLISATQQALRPQIGTLSPAGMYNSYTTLAAPPTFVQHPAIQVSTHAAQVPTVSYMQPYQYAQISYPVGPNMPAMEPHHRPAQHAFAFKDELWEDDPYSMLGGH